MMMQGATTKMCLQTRSQHHSLQWTRMGLWYLTHGRELFVSSIRLEWGSLVLLGFTTLVAMTPVTTCAAQASLATTLSWAMVPFGHSHVAAGRTCGSAALRRQFKLWVEIGSQCMKSLQANSPQMTMSPFATHCFRQRTRFCCTTTPQPVEMVCGPILTQQTTALECNSCCFVINSAATGSGPPFCLQTAKSTMRLVSIRAWRASVAGRRW
mmetsp:Transcript_16858/g.39162  ORF Transcript_16858/g.39162 Transcript_16858/m.39162 type:complete len:211 (-) Transcript_16858:1405-2037(-)